MKKVVKVGNVLIGNGDVSVQTMLAAKTEDVERNIEEIVRLKNEGCDIVRIAVSTDKEAEALKKICEGSVLPIVSDIQFDHRLAIKSIEAGAAKIRINPCYIGGEDNIKAVCDAAKANNVPIRVGVNMGSLEESAEKKYGRTAEGLAHSAINCAAILERHGFDDIVLSVKSSNVLETVKACRIINELSSYPQHIGVTEAGTKEFGEIKNAIGIGSLLLDGIGDTIRVSLSAPPIEEVRAGIRILRALDIKKGVKVISCPTCSRCDYDLFSLAKEIEDKTFSLKGDLKIAVMGCVVNGIGEGKDADIGIVGGKEGFVVIKKGQVVERLPKDGYKERFLEMVKEELDAKSRA